MGAAKKRGTFEQRKQHAIENAPRPISEETKQQMRDHIGKLAEQEEKTARQLIPAYLKYTRFFDRIMHSAATPAELVGL